MDVRFINPFIESVNNLFRTMLSAEITVGKPCIRQSNEPCGDVTAVIGLSGNAAGCIAVSFPEATAVNAATAFSGETMTPGHEDFGDALGELANIIAGGAKARFEGLDTSISLPTVITGREHAVSQSKRAPLLCIPFDSTLGRFEVEVALEVRREPSPSSASVSPVAAHI